VFFSAALARYISGREQARKLAKAQLSRQPSNSLHLSFDNPVKVIGRELEEQKVTGLVSVLHSREFGNRILYDSITSNATLPLEQLSIAAMRPRQTSCSPWGLPSYTISSQIEN
jgi:hypothetical protein